jgi:hypothetical protein
MPDLSTPALMAAWEDGMGEPLVDRAPTLLRSLGLVEPGRDPSDLTVGACDLLLFDLRGRLFGSDLDLAATCPSCGQGVEVVIPTEQVLPDKPDVPPPLVTVETDGLRIRSRVPTNRNLRDVFRYGPEATITDLLERCVDTVDGPGAPYAPADLPAAVAEHVADALAASDPGAEVTVEIECPCGAQWSEILDIRSILWGELTRWVQARLVEVHQLASVYGWAEGDILAMSPLRRAFYLESSAR